MKKILGIKTIHRSWRSPPKDWKYFLSLAGCVMNEKSYILQLTQFDDDCPISFWRLPDDCTISPDNCLTTSWQLPNKLLMIAWWLPDNRLMTSFRLLDDCLMTAWQLLKNMFTSLIKNSWTLFSYLKSLFQSTLYSRLVCYQEAFLIKSRY